MDDAANLVRMGILASLVAGLGTGLGALGIFAVRELSQPVNNALLSLAAGIMLAASVFSLVLPGIDYAAVRVDQKTLAVAIVSVALLIGAVVLHLIHRFLPHEHFRAGREGPRTSLLDRIWLFVIAIALHNFPEGMAVGVGFAGGDIANGLSLAMGIGLQNLPEGWAVAASLLVVGYSRIQAFSVALLTGLVEPIGGAFGSILVYLAEPLLPWTLGFAAGAMLFVISDEVIPETHRGESEGLATFALLVGFVIMMFLEAALG
jgi:ZIP family zinc transporter